MRRLLAVLLAASAVSSAGCSGDDAESVPAAEGLFVVGPEGGEWTADPTSSLAGVRLVIPPNALQREIAIDIDGALDGTPLPNQGRHVGPLVSISPAGTKLALPALLTLPFDAVDLAEFEVPDARDCKVWIRQGDAWARRDLVEYTDTTVTIELPELTVAGVGIFASSAGKTCKGACPPPKLGAPYDQPCVSPTGLCVVEYPPLKAPFASLEGVVVSDEGRLLYLTPIHTGGTSKPAVPALATYDLRAGATDVSVALPPAAKQTLIRARGAYALDKNATRSLSIDGYGNVGFVPKAAATISDGDAATLSKTPPAGIVNQSSGESARFFREIVAGPGIVLHGSFGSSPRRELFRASVPTVPNVTVLRRPSVMGPSEFVAFSEHHGIRLFDAATPSLGKESLPAGTKLTTFAVSDATNDLAYVTTTSGGSTLVWLRPEDKEVQRADIVLPVAPTSIAFDDEGRLYAINRKRPEVHVIGFEGGVVTIPLTDAAEGTPEYARATPFRLYNVPGTNELLMLRGVVENLPDLSGLRRGTPEPPPSADYRLDEPFSMNQGDFKVLELPVPAGARVTVKTAATFDADLYMRAGAPPTLTAFDARPYAAGGDETISFVAQGPVFIGVHAFGGSGEVRVTADADALAGGAAQTPPADHIDISGDLALGEMRIFPMQVTAGSRVVVRTTASRDVDLYLQFGAAPTTASYSARGFTDSGNEELTYTPSETGLLHIGVHGFAASEFTLKTSDD